MTMQPLAMGPHLRRGLDCRHAVPTRAEARRIAPGAGADVEHAARRLGKQMQDVAMHVSEGQALVLLHENVCSLAVPLRTACSHRRLFLSRGNCEQKDG